MASEASGEAAQNLREGKIDAGDGERAGDVGHEQVTLAAVVAEEALEHVRGLRWSAGTCAL